MPTYLTSSAERWHSKAGAVKDNRLQEQEHKLQEVMLFACLVTNYPNK